jgi:hypothetical protein
MLGELCLKAEKEGTLVQRKTPLTGNEWVEILFPIPFAEMTPLVDKWLQTNAVIQDVFPMLNADQREFLMTGLSGAAFDDAMGDDE